MEASRCKDYVLVLLFVKEFAINRRRPACFDFYVSKIEKQLGFALMLYLKTASFLDKVVMLPSTEVAVSR